MVKFAHIADVHLGGWKQQPLQNLNFESFKKTIDICLNSKLDFILFSGDLFDSAYPPIEILKETFAQFRRLKEANLPCFIIAGSHDYSVSGKTFLDVLEKTGFCKNVFNAEEKDDEILLHPHLHGNVAIYGYPGKKSGLEIQDLRKVKLNEAPGMFKIFMLHTTIDAVVGNIPMDYLKTSELPKADYYALGHIHVLYNQNNFVYPGPLFPNTFRELEDLEKGSFVLVDTESTEPVEFIKIPTKKVEKISIKLEDGFLATEQIILELKKRSLKDKIILLRIFGELKRGKNSDIKFSQIQDYIDSQEAYFILKNTHDLKTKETELELEVDTEENIEEKTIDLYSKQNPSELNSLLPQLINALSIEKQEDEKNETFNRRLLEEAKKILKF